MRSAFLLLTVVFFSACETWPEKGPPPAGDVPALSSCTCDLSDACDTSGSVSCFCDADCPSDGTLVIAPASLDGFDSVSCDGSLCQVDLGLVPVFAEKSVTFRIHVSGPPVVITGTQPSTSDGWRVSPADDAYPVVLGAAIHEVTVTSRPGEGSAEAVRVEILSNAAGGPYVLAVEADAVFVGAPDIEVQYPGYLGPFPGNCTDANSDGQPDTCVIPENRALDFGSVQIDTTESRELILRNTAECAPYVGIDPCTLCQLTIDDDPDRQNIGFGFKPGSDPDGVFSFVGSIGTPVAIRQRNIAAPCAESGEIDILLNFHAPSVPGEFGAVIVVESNDPDESVIEIPVTAWASHGPVAIAKLRELDPLNPDSNWTNPDDIQPLNRVYFDGRDSYSPGSGIASYQWQVIEYPSGLDTNDFQMQGDTTGLFSFWAPLAGRYVVQLTVWNEDGIENAETPESRVELDVVPGSRLQVELTWDDDRNDQNLHLLYLPESDVACAQPWDCYTDNPTPIWDGGSPAGDGSNPRLDFDDSHGLGPEHISIDAPQAATYRVAVHYFADYADHSATRNTVRIYLNGLEVAEYRRTLSEETVWHVANIVWLADGTGYMDHLEPDAAGQVGSVAPLTRATCDE